MVLCGSVIYIYLIFLPPSVFIQHLTFTYIQLIFGRSLCNTSQQKFYRSSLPHCFIQQVFYCPILVTNKQVSQRLPPCPLSNLSAPARRKAIPLLFAICPPLGGLLEQPRCRSSGGGGGATGWDGDRFVVPKEGVVAMSPCGTCGAASAAGSGRPSPELSSVPERDPAHLPQPAQPARPAARQAGTGSDFPAAPFPGKGVRSSLAELSMTANLGTRREMFAVL